MDQKINATPLTSIAKVIDSLSPQTNDRTNAPSIRAVNEVKSFSHFAVKKWNGNSSAKYIIVKDSSYSDTDTFETAMNGVQLVYELATPIIIPLTPQQIKLLKGTNHLSCNTGDLSIKYYPDNVLGQLKGDIEDEYDERLSTLETQMVGRPELKSIALSGTTSNVGIYENISLRNIIPVFFKDNYGYTFLFRGASVLSFRVIGDSNEIKTNYNFSGVLYYYELEG